MALSRKHFFLFDIQWQESINIITPDSHYLIRQFIVQVIKILQFNKLEMQNISNLYA